MFKPIAALAAFAAVAIANPVPATTTSTAASTTSTPFTLQMLVNGAYEKVNAVENGSTGEYLLLAGLPDAGLDKEITQSYFGPEDTDGYSALFVEIEGTTYGAGIFPIGDAYGDFVVAYAKKDYEQKQWTASNTSDSVGHKAHAALSFLASCWATENDRNNIYLAMASPKNPSLEDPNGCNGTSLRQVPLS